MTPEELCGKRTIRTIPALPGAETIYDAEGQPAVLRMQNERGAMEVFLTEAKKHEYLPLLQGDKPVSLSGFFRRRSGFHKDGSRHFIWCLVLFSAELMEEDLPLAA
jgi:hypothetical protein